MEALQQGQLWSWQIDELERIVLLGDSLIRHLYQGLLILLTGDVRTGSLAPWTFVNETV